MCVCVCVYVCVCVCNSHRHICEVGVIGKSCNTGWGQKGLLALHWGMCIISQILSGQQHFCITNADLGYENAISVRDRESYCFFYAGLSTYGRPCSRGSNHFWSSLKHFPAIFIVGHPSFFQMKLSYFSDIRRLSLCRTVSLDFKVYSCSLGRLLERDQGMSQRGNPPLGVVRTLRLTVPRCLEYIISPVRNDEWFFY